MKLSRFVVAMPAYASLVIDADISDSQGRFVGGSVEFQWPGQCKKLIDDEFGTIVVILGMGNAFKRFYSEVDFKHTNVAWDALRRNSQVGVSNTVHQTKDLVPYDQQQNSMTRLGTTHSFSSRRPPLENNIVDEDERMPATGLLEVFSAYVGGKNHEVSAFCGNISVDDYFNHEISANISFAASFNSKSNMFERGVDNPEFLSPRKGFLSIEGLYLIEDDTYVAIELHLKDPIANKEVCSGSIYFNNAHFFSERGKDMLLDKRLCSVVLGTHGYVLLHYIVFNSARLATVEIMFLPDHPSSVPNNIFGCIFASYNNHNYSMNYEKKFYPSQLFNKPQTESVELDHHSRVPLLKSVVAVPCYAALVEVDLQAMSISKPKDVLFGKREFKISKSKTRREEILGKYYGVHISAKFSWCCNIP